MSELKKCPFSNMDKCIECDWFGNCEFSQTDMPFELWNNRPIEDELQAEIKQLNELLAKAHEKICSLDCPSVWKTGEKQPHNELCIAISHALKESEE